MSSINKRQVSINVIINLAVGEFYLISIGLMDVEVSSLEVIEESSVSQQWSPILVFNIEHLQDYFPTLILTISQIRSHNKHTATNILFTKLLYEKK